MKKLLVLFVAVVATISSFAATEIYFNRQQFQWSSAPAFAGNNADWDVQLTVPFVYKGSIAFKSDWAYEPADLTLHRNEREEAKCLISSKKNIPAIMTICQPCIDCYPCDVLDVAQGIQVASAKAGQNYTGIVDPNDDGFPGWITVWNLYLVTDVDKKEKEVFIYKIDLTDATTVSSVFFTGSKKGDAYVKAVSVANGYTQMQLTGPKNDYKFNYYIAYLTVNGNWESAGGSKKQIAHIKSAKSLNGTIYYNYLDGFGNDTTADQVEILDVAGTVKLTRDSSWTGKAIKGAFGGEVKKVKDWSDCTAAAQAKSCEEYFLDPDNFEDAYFGSAYKKYDIFVIDADAETIFDEFFDETKAFDYIEAPAPAPAPQG